MSNSNASLGKPDAEKERATAPRRRWRSRRWLPAAAVVGVVALGAALAPWTFSTAALLEEIAGQLRSSSGLHTAAQGRSWFSLLPRPHISVEKISFADPGAALTIEAEKFYGNVRIAPLFAGRLELADVTLTRPEIAIDLDRKPMTLDGAAPRAAATRPATPEADKADRARLGSVSFVAGAARVKYGGKEEILEDIDATLDWRTVGSVASLSGAFSWRGERLQTLLSIPRPAALLRGDQSPVSWRLDGDSVHLDAEGVGQTGARPRFTGRVTASSPSLRHALKLVNLSVPLPGPFEDVQLSCKITASPRDFQMSDLRFSADNNEFEGSLSLRHEEGKPIVHATLASNFLSLRPLVADVPPLSGQDGQWSRDVFQIPDLRGADVDLRLSAARARLLRLTIDDAALSLMLRAGRLEIALAQAEAYKGSIKGRATFSANAASGLDFHASAQIDGVDAGALVWDLAGRQGIAGNLDSTVALDASGDSVAQLMRELDGRASFVVAQGEIAGIDLERALRRLDKRPLSSALDIRSGHTTLERASGTIKIAKGTANVEEGLARGPGFSLAFSGAARFPERSLALKGQATEADSAGKPRDKGLQISFDLSGPWDELMFAPDAAALIKRSGAAAPLLPRAESQTQADTPR